MAVSNRDRVGRGFELLAEGLEDFVDEVMSGSVPAGTDWQSVLEARDSAKFGTTKTYSKSDPQFQLRVITEEWRAGFADRLSRSEQSIASILREQRNNWAHNSSFSADDTSHVLDLIERLLLAAGAVDSAAIARKLRQDHQRAQYEADTRRAVKETRAASSGVAGQGLKAWREVIQPHPDVASGQYAAAEFAADLDGVARNEGSEEYTDPVAFFRRTYLTAGLRDLLTRATKRISGDTNASPVINLQTNFGGGKTHSMLALYHLASATPLSAYPQDIQDLLADRQLPTPGSIKRVTLVGNRISAGKGTHHTDEQGTVHIKTLWGELAWQLGGREAYEKVATDDDRGTNPGNTLKELLQDHSPCLILIDEWVAYARELYGKDDLDAGSFDTQFGFAQTLTEVAKAVPGTLLVVSIPASEKLVGQELDGSALDNGTSDLEVGGVHGREALKRLQQVVGRVADEWQPATAEESFEIVRRRLFQETDAAGKADLAAVARAFVEYYRANSGEFPRECSEPAYEARIKAAYPIHPQLFDRLYKDWSALPRFQRTRGVLRLMSKVVHALWNSGDAGPLIMPASLPLDETEVVSELTKYLDDEWKPIVHTDVDGDASTPVQIDASRTTFGSRSVTRRLARTVFFGSAPTLRTAHKGIERQYLWLGTALPGDTVGNFGSALDLLAQRATYFYPEGGRYWYDTAQSVTRKAQDYAERLRNEPEVVWAEIQTRLKNEQRTLGDFRAITPAPESTAEVADQEEARLVLLHPKYAHGRGETDSKAQQFAARCLKERGSAQRINTNQLVFLAPDKKRLEELEDAVRFYLGWKDVAARSGPEDLNLTGQQAKQATTQRDEFNHTVDLRISGTYTWVIIPYQPVPNEPYKLSVLRAKGEEPRLAERATKALHRDGALAARYGSRNVRMDLEEPLQSVWQRGHLTLGELWGYYRRYPYLSRLRDRSVLEEAALAALDQPLWVAEGFALAEGFDETTGVYRHLSLPPHDRFGVPSDDTLLVRPELAVAQREREQQKAEALEAAAREAAAVAGGSETSARPIEPGASVAEPGIAPVVAPEPPRAQHTRFFGVYPLDPERTARDFGKFVEEILPHLRAPDGATVRLRIEVEAEYPEGYSEDKVRVVTENARTLKFSEYGFEDE